VNTWEEHNFDPGDTGADLVGKSYTFADGIVIRVMQSKRRELGYWVTYEVVYANALPKKMVMSVGEFRSKYDHLFRGQ
jgi:hypothetical protein